MDLEEIQIRIKNLRTYANRVINYSVILNTLISLLFLSSLIIFVGNFKNYTLEIFIIQMILLAILVACCIFFYYSKISQGDYANYIAEQYSIQYRNLQASTSDNFEEDTITLYDFVEIELTPYRDVLNNEYDKLSSNLFFPK